MNLYLGAPNDEWDMLTQYAEDILYTDVPGGQHILGIYPFGNRIFGLESEPPNILCLYLRDLSMVLNPLRNSPSYSNLYPPVMEFTVNNGGSKIIFFDFYYWISAARNGIVGHSDPMFHIVPTKSDIIYQDDSISDILQHIGKFLESEIIDTARFQLSGIDGTAHRRAIVLYKLTGIFEPCLNKDWQNIRGLKNLINCPENIDCKDKDIIDCVTQGEVLSDENLKEYNEFLYREYNYKLLMRKEYEKTANYEHLIEAASCTEKLLRRLL